MPSDLRDRADKRLVIDGSAAVHAAVVLDAFTGWESFQFFAPTLLWSEAASGISQMRWRNEITGDQAIAAVRRLLGARIDFVRSEELVEEAIILARDLGWAKSYDAEYVVLAQRLAVPLVTLDARLAATVTPRIKVLSPADVESWAHS